MKHYSTKKRYCPHPIQTKIRSAELFRQTHVDKGLLQARSQHLYMGISKNRFEKVKSTECTHYGFAETLLLGKPTKQGCMPCEEV